MKKINQYSKAGSLYLIGNLFNKGIAFLMVPIFTRLLTIYDYGVVNTYSSWVGILSIVLGMTFHMGIRAAFNDYRDNIDDFMTSVTFFSIISAFSMSFLIVLGVFLLKIDINITLVIMCLCQGFFMAIIQNYSMYLMMKLEYKKRTLVLILPNLIITIISIIAISLILESDLYLGRIISSVLVNMIFGIFIIYIIFKKSKVINNRLYWKYALKISFPIILHGLSLNILSQSDRIMITTLVSASETGVYSLIYNFCMIATVVSVSLEGVWIPWFTHKLKDRAINEINDKVKIYIGIMTIVICAIILVSPEVIKIMAPKEYWYGQSIIPPIVIASFIVFIYTLYVNIEHFHKKTQMIAMNTVIAAGSNIVLNFIFIPQFGIYAAAVTTLLSYMLSLALHYINSRKVEKELFSLILMAKPVLMISVTVLIYYLFIDAIIIRWLMLIIIISLLILLNKNRFMTLLNKK